MNKQVKKQFEITREYSVDVTDKHLFESKLTHLNNQLN